MHLVVKQITSQEKQEKKRFESCKVDLIVAADIGNGGQLNWSLWAEWMQITPLAVYNSRKYHFQIFDWALGLVWKLLLLFIRVSRHWPCWIMR